MKNDIFEIVTSYVNFKENKTFLNLMFFSLITGLITGIVVSFYTLLLEKMSIIRNTILNISFFNINIALLFILTIIIAIFIQYTITKYPLISGSGIPQVMALIQGKVKFNWFFELIYKFLSGLLAIFLGFSLGREGPSIHLGSLIGDGINKIFKKSEVEKKYLITCGASAGLAAAFNAPLSGAIFAIEELHKFFSPILIICVLISSIFANLVSKFLLGIELSFNHLSFVSPIDFKIDSVLIHILLITILCIIMLLFSKLFNFSIVKFKNIYNSIKLNSYLKLILFSLFSLFIAVFFPEISGGGHSLVHELIDNSFTLKFIFLILIAKFIFTMISYSTGIPGGIFLPLLVIGALIGKIYGILLVNIFSFDNSYTTLFMLIAMTSYFTAIVRSPITGIILILEMSGNFSNLFSLVITAAITYTLSELSKSHSVYDILFENMFSNNKNDKKINKNNIVLKIPILSDSDLENKLISEIKWPKNFLIVGIERENKNFIPRGSTRLKKSDLLIVLANEEDSDKYSTFINKMAFKIEL